MPHLAHPRVYDNSRDLDPGVSIRDPTLVLVLEMIAGRCTWPEDPASPGRTPEWAKPLVEAALPPSDRRTERHRAHPCTARSGQATGFLTGGPGSRR